MGHINHQVLKHTAQVAGIKLTGAQEKCVACLKAKFKTININKVTSLPSNYPGERLHLDLSSIKSPSIGGSTYWGMIIDDYTKFKWSIFLRTKDELTTKGAHLLHQINKVHPIKCIRMDNTLGLLYSKISPQDLGKKWVMRAYSDSDWAGDKATRKSVSGWCIFLRNNLIAWKSRGQKCTALSSTEAEYVALSELCVEVLHVRSLLVFLGQDLKFPIQIQVDNVGAIFLATNYTGKRTRHIDARYHFLRDYVEDGTIKIEFITSEENVSDIFTKNLPKETFEKHSNVLLQNIGYTA